MEIGKENRTNAGVVGSILGNGTSEILRNPEPEKTKVGILADMIFEAARKDANSSKIDAAPISAFMQKNHLEPGDLTTAYAMASAKYHALRRV